MNKNVLAFVLISSITSSAFARNGEGKNSGNNQNEQKNQNQNGQPKRTSRAEKCIDLKTKIAQEKATSATTGGSVAATSESDRAICAALEGIAKMSGGELEADPQSESTMDNKITCVKRAGYTLDYKSCTSTATMYDYIKVAEQSLTLTEGIQAQRNSQKGQQEVTQRTAAGDGQQAAIDAVIAQNNQMRQMNQARASAYTAAVAALGSSIMKWQSDDATKVTAQCNQNQEVKAVPNHYSSSPTPITCNQIVKDAFSGSKDEIFANAKAKQRFQLALIDFVQKGIKAGIEANKFGNVAQKLEGAKETIPTEDQIALEHCAVYPTDPICLTPGNRVAGPSYKGGDFSLGSGGANAFNMNDGTGTSFGEEGVPTTIDDSERVASVNNPFAEDAKIAKDILNPAGAATLQPTGGAGGGGGGGGGGLGGGGSASLGDDLKGADENPNKEAEIKANKSGSAYGPGGATAFAGVKGSKDAENPFASLFDSKGDGSGGIEEDRSIASDTGEGSGLFQKISNRYSKIQEAKRIEANNLE